MMMKPLSPKKFLQRNESIVRLALVIFFGVGLAGFAIPATRALFSGLTPVALILSLLTLFAFHHSTGGLRNPSMFLAIVLAGFLIEVAGIRTGIIFGEYSYGNGLGPQLLKVPVLIGFNWLMMVYSTRIVAAGIFASPSLRIITASLLMVFYDIVLEQVAPNLGMWQFSGGNPPVRNYVSWFALSILFHSLLTLSGTRYYNRIAPFVFFLQFLFFIALFFILTLVK
ncbi:MAG: carotenoid biosynthesis protein [Bacteroidales bacterium]|jgi:putative membrane protein|nr:carotenoid biosynthesis protein [Bacteroidales bacterium]